MRTLTIKRTNVNFFFGGGSLETVLGGSAPLVPAVDVVQHIGKPIVRIDNGLGMH